MPCCTWITYDGMVWHTMVPYDTVWWDTLCCSINTQEGLIQHQMMWHNTMRCGILCCNRITDECSIWLNTVYYDTMWCGILQSSHMYIMDRWDATQYNDMIQWCRVWSTAGELNTMAWCNTTQYDMIQIDGYALLFLNQVWWHGATCHGMIWYDMMLYALP